MTSETQEGLHIADNVTDYICLLL